MKKLKASLSKKLKGTDGESIAEVLIALLIAALALTMLASVISTSARMITQSKTKMAEYYTANNELTEHAKTAGEWTVTIEDEAENVISLTHDSSEMTVNYYINNKVSDTPVIGFWKKSTEGVG